MQDQFEKIQSVILQAYKSLSSPNFSFVMESIQRDPYADIVKQLRQIFRVVEETEPNYDVSFVYEVKKSNQYWLVKISMVGPYAIVLRLYNPGDKPTLITPSSSNLSAVEQSIFLLLAQHNIQILDRDTLLLPVPLPLFATEPENVRVYQALFSDEDVIPWE